jgi:hypothetical protein
VSGFFVAVETFVDPSDGQLIEAGRTHVLSSADVFRMFPARFRRLKRDTGSRIYGLLAHSDDSVGISRAAQSRRPSWQLTDDDGGYTEAWRLRR